MLPNSIRNSFLFFSPVMSEPITAAWLLPRAGRKEHQGLAPNTARRVSALKSRKGVWVQVDGAVNDQTIGLLATAGADAVNSGSFVAEAKDPKEALKLLERKFEEGKK